MTDEQLRILVAAPLLATDPMANYSVALKCADALIAAARASSPPAAKAPDPLNDGRWCACCGRVQTPHTDSPDCQCAVCLKRDARRWCFYAKEFDPSGFYQITLDALIAAEDAKDAEEQSK